MSTMSEIHAEMAEHRARVAVLLPLRGRVYFRHRISAIAFRALVRLTGRPAYIIGG